MLKTRSKFDSHSSLLSKCNQFQNMSFLARIPQRVPIESQISKQLIPHQVKNFSTWISTQINVNDTLQFSDKTSLQNFTHQTTNFSKCSLHQRTHLRTLIKQNIYVQNIFSFGFLQEYTIKTPTKWKTCNDWLELDLRQRPDDKGRKTLIWHCPQLS